MALVWTLGLTQLVIGHLNVATGFLPSIVAGNGINVGILYQSRYFEERRAAAGVVDSLRTSVFATWQPTVIAALASAASYVSLLSTDFGAFRQFGFIAASGMLFCWVVKTLMVPPLLLLLERRRPIDDSRDGRLLTRIRRFGMGYGRIFAWLVPKAPALMLAVGRARRGRRERGRRPLRPRDPMEYDMGKLGNDPQPRRRDRPGVVRRHRHPGLRSRRHGRLADTPEDARSLERKLKADWDAAPEGKKPFAAVHTLWSIVADDQAEKIPVLLEIGERLERARARGTSPTPTGRRSRTSSPRTTCAPTASPICPRASRVPSPRRTARAAGSSLIEPEPDKSGDLRYLLRYSDSFRETRLPNGKIVRGSGRGGDLRRHAATPSCTTSRSAVSLSLGLTILAVLVTFRRGGWHALSVLFALLVGVAGETLFLYFADVKINFLNFSALPITFGIGVDYAVNVAQRYRADGSRDILGALRTTGGAVVLCSLTTMLGYLALVGSLNRGIRSLGVIAVVGEVSCLLAAVLVLPSLWLLVERRRAKAAQRGPA